MIAFYKKLVMVKTSKGKNTAEAKGYGYKYS